MRQDASIPTFFKKQSRLNKYLISSMPTVKSVGTAAATMLTAWRWSRAVDFCGKDCKIDTLRHRPSCIADFVQF